MDRKSRILVLTTSFPRYRGDHEGFFVFELCKRVSEKFEIMVLAPHAPHAKTREDFEGMTVQRFRYAFPESLEQICYGAGILTNLRNRPWLFFFLPVFLLFDFISIFTVLLRFRPHLVHVHWLIPNGVFALLLAPLLGSSVIVTAHGSDVMTLSTWFWTFLRRWVVSKASAVTVVSTIMQQMVNSESPSSQKNIFCIPMGVDTSRFALSGSLERTEPRILFVGWLHEAKGLRFLLQAFAKIISTYRNARLQIVGIGPDKMDLENLARSLNIFHQVEFLGSLSNKELPKLYQSASIFVLPSFSEGTPVSMLEAMACGCAVIATSVGGIPDVIAHEKNGLLVNPGNVEEVEQAIKRLIVDSQFAQSVRQAARKTVVEGYDWKIVGGKFERLYDKVLAEKHL